MRVAQGTLGGEFGPARVIATATRTGTGGADDHELQAPQVEHFHDDSVLVTFKRVAYANGRDQYNPAEQFASVDFGAPQRIGESPNGRTMTLAADPSGWAVITWANQQGPRRRPAHRLELRRLEGGGNHCAPRRLGADRASLTHR